MRRVALALLSIAHVAAGTTEIYIYENEIWIGNAPHLEQITHDKAGKSYGTFSPAKDAVAYVEDCGNAAQGGCSPRLVFRDLKGNELYSFPPLLHSDRLPCLSVLHLDWIDRDRVGFHCHLNPSLSEYSVMSISKAASVAGYSGGPFAWSPDRTHMAYGGPVIHFAPPWAQSFFLCLDDQLMYPLRTSGKFCHDMDNPNEIAQKGATHIGIRALVSDLAWRPDGSAIAFVESIFDWVAPEPSATGGGDYLERGYFLVLVPLDGPAIRRPLTVNGRGSHALKWLGASTLEVRQDGANPQTFRLGPSGLSPK